MQTDQDSSKCFKEALTPVPSVTESARTAVTWIWTSSTLCRRLASTEPAALSRATSEYKQLSESCFLQGKESLEGGARSGASALTSAFQAEGRTVWGVSLPS